MKYLICFLSLVISSVALAEDPAELVKLRKTWENSQAEAKKSAEEIYRSKNIKANKLYYEELNEMKKNFMTAQNLQGAIAVDAEIKRLEKLHKVLKFEVPKKEKPVVAVSPINTKAMLEGMVGEYKSQKAADGNDWHYGSITIEQRNKQGCPVVLRWTIKAGRSWLLFPDLTDGLFRTSLDAPYYKDKNSRNYELITEPNSGRLVGFTAWHGHKFLREQ